MHSSDRILIILLTIFAFAFAYATEVKASPELEQSYPWIEVQQDHGNPLTEVPWPKGEKVPCRCDILAIDYELCLKGIGREDCFKVKEVEQPQKPKESKPLGQPVIYPEVLACHPEGQYLEKMQEEFQLYPFAQGKGVVRNGQTYNFDRPDMFMLVNPLTKKYVMVGLWPNGYACLLASGEEFEMLTKEYSD